MVDLANLVTYKDIEIVYQQGGYEFVDFCFGGIRMPKGISKNLSPEAYRRWIRYLRWRWCKNNPDFVKRQNKYYARKRQKEKPYTAVCIKCGKEFKAPRAYYKICPDCQKLPTKTQLLKQAIAERKAQREANIKEAKYWYSKGETQEVLAEDFGVTQKTISNWVNKK